MLIDQADFFAVYQKFFEKNKRLLLTRHKWWMKLHVSISPIFVHQSEPRRICVTGQKGWGSLMYRWGNLSGEKVQKMVNLKPRHKSESFNHDGWAAPNRYKRKPPTLGKKLLCIRWFLNDSKFLKPIWPKVY